MIDETMHLLTMSYSVQHKAILPIHETLLAKAALILSPQFQNEIAIETSKVENNFQNLLRRREFTDEMDIFQEEGHNQCLSQLKEMGYPEQAAQQAL